MKYLFITVSVTIPSLNFQSYNTNIHRFSLLLFNALTLFSYHILYYDIPTQMCEAGVCLHGDDWKCRKGAFDRVRDR